MHRRSPLRCLHGIVVALVLGLGTVDGQQSFGQQHVTPPGPQAAVTLPGFSPAETALIRTLSPLPPMPPPDPTNAYADNLQAAELGRKLF